MNASASVHCLHYRACLALMVCVEMMYPCAWIGAMILTDVTEQTGIDFVHTDGSQGGYFIMETVSAGLALFDYDADGWIDIYFLNGAPLAGAKHAQKPRNRLYRNQGNWRFTDVTDQAGVGDTGFGLGVTVGDIDNDGDPDLYLNNYGPNVLYRNNGDGTFTDITQTAGVSNGAKVGAGTCFLDMDKDGDLDLYVANYLHFSYDLHVARSAAGFPVYASPRCYRPLADNLYRNNGNSTFTDVSQASGIAAHVGWGMGLVSADYDNDGDTDILIANDVAENFLFQNNGSGQFQEVALMAAIAYDINGEEQGSMGVDCGDFNNDGLLDFLMTSYQKQWTLLYQNIGQGMFQDITLPAGAGADTLPKVTWGNSLVDLDLDGDLDLFIACGHLQDRVDSFDPSSTYYQDNILLENTGHSRFQNISAQGGSGMQVRLSSRGAGFDDLDNDGDIDVVILNSRREPTLMRNDTSTQNHWLQIQLQGQKSNRDGIGAQVRVRTGGRTQLREVHGARGYQSFYGKRLYFGLGTHAKVDQIEVRWIGGGTDIHRNIKADQRIHLVEGKTSVGK
jgi:enediyne biosynthesis protein E4